MPPAMKVWFLNRWTIREVPRHMLKLTFIPWMRASVRWQWTMKQTAWVWIPALLLSSHYLNSCLHLLVCKMLTRVLYGFCVLSYNSEKCFSSTIWFFTFRDNPDVLKHSSHHLFGISQFSIRSTGQSGDSGSVCRAAQKHTGPGVCLYTGQEGSLTAAV